MKKLAWVLVVWAFTWSAQADEFARSSKFESVEAFVAAAKTFEPLKAKGEMSALFTVKEMGQPEDPKTGIPVPAKAIVSCDVLWEGQNFALIFSTAAPPTEATRSAVGVLFLLKKVNAEWQIADLLRFEATGKYAEVEAELTAGTGSGYNLGDDGMKPIVTIKEHHGGRGYGYQLSASYTLEKSHLKRMDLE